MLVAQSGRHRAQLHWESEVPRLICTVIVTVLSHSRSSATLAPSSSSVEHWTSIGACTRQAGVVYHVTELNSLRSKRLLVSISRRATLGLFDSRVHSSSGLVFCSPPEPTTFAVRCTFPSSNQLCTEPGLCATTSCNSGAALCTYTNPVLTEHELVNSSCLPLGIDPN